jgi:hypothetical protein
VLVRVADAAAVEFGPPAGEMAGWMPADRTEALAADLAGADGAVAPALPALRRAAHLAGRMMMLPHLNRR